MSGGGGAYPVAASTPSAATPHSSAGAAAGYLQPESQFDISSHPSTADLNIPPVHSRPSSNSSSSSNSPTSVHVAKRQRVINSGSDLLEDVRQQFSYVKGGNMFAPPSAPPSAMSSPRAPAAYGAYPGAAPQVSTAMPLNMQIPSQFNFGNSGCGPQPFAMERVPNPMQVNNVPDVNKLPNKSMFPGGVSVPPERPNSTGSGVYPPGNNMYPSQANNQAFNQQTHDAHPNMNMSSAHSRNMHLSHQQSQFNQGLPHAGAHHQQMTMQMQHSQGYHSRPPHMPPGADGYSSSPTQFPAGPGGPGFMNKSRQLPAQGMNRMNTYGLPPNSQCGPSQAYGRPSAMGGPHGSAAGPPPEYRNQSPAPSMMPMNMHGPNMNMLMSDSPLDASRCGSVAPPPPHMMNPAAAAMSGEQVVAESIVPTPPSQRPPGASSAKSRMPLPTHVLKHIIDDTSHSYRANPLFPLLRNPVTANIIARLWRAVCRAVIVSALSDLKKSRSLLSLSTLFK